MRGILEQKQYSSLQRPLQEGVLFQPESVIIFYGSQASTEGIITIFNRSGQTLQYSVKSNNKHSYKVKEPKGYLPPGKTIIYFIALKKNSNQQQMVTGDKFRVDIWRSSRPLDLYSKQYRVALKDDRGNLDGGGVINENGFSTMVQNSGRTGTFASFSNRHQQLNWGVLGLTKPKNRILQNQQKQIQKISARRRVLEQQLLDLKDEDALLQKKYFSILEDKENKIIKWYLIVVILGFALGIILRYVATHKNWFNL